MIMRKMLGCCKNGALSNKIPNNQSTHDTGCTG